MSIAIKEEARYIKMQISIFGINFLHRVHPWAAAWWSAAIPGFGHMYMGYYIRGLIFMSGEIFINLKSRINLAIFYTFTGNFEKANHALNERWALFYMAVWVFAMYDAWKLTIEGNKICELEEAQEQREFKRMNILGPVRNQLEQRPPLLAAFFSIVLGGIGQIYNGQYIKGIILTLWTIVINYNAQTNHLLGKFLMGKEIYLEMVNWQWLLFLPSIYGFCIFDAYMSAIEINKLQIEEQRYYLSKKENFHGTSKRKKFPLIMYGGTKQSVDLELLVNSLKTHDIDKYKVVFLDRLNNDNREIGDSIRRSDGISNFNGALCGATVLMLFGTMWGGPVIPGGPIAIGLAGFLLGAALGYVIDRYLVGWIRVKLNLDTVKGSNSIDGEVLVLVNALDKDQYNYVKKTFLEKNISFVGEAEQASFGDFFY